MMMQNTPDSIESSACQRAPDFENAVRRLCEADAKLLRHDWVRDGCGTIDAIAADVLRVFRYKREVRLYLLNRGLICGQSRERANFLRALAQRRPTGLNVDVMVLCIGEDLWMDLDAPDSEEVAEAGEVAWDAGARDAYKGGRNRASAARVAILRGAVPAQVSEPFEEGRTAYIGGRYHAATALLRESVRVAWRDGRSRTRRGGRRSVLVRLDDYKHRDATPRSQVGTFDNLRQWLITQDRRSSRQGEDSQQEVQGMYVTAVTCLEALYDTVAAYDERWPSEFSAEAGDLCTSTRQGSLPFAR